MRITIALLSILLSTLLVFLPASLDVPAARAISQSRSDRQGNKPRPGMHPDQHSGHEAHADPQGRVSDGFRGIAE